MSAPRYYLWSAGAECILQAIEKHHEHVTLSTDLNRSVCTLPIHGDQVLFDDHNTLDMQHLLTIAARQQRVFVLENNTTRILEFRADHYYKLVPTSGAPTVEIDGVKMHRSKGIDPFLDAKEKAQEVVRAGDRVLDTCGGLGYTSIWALRLGAREVLSVERCDEIRRLRRENPWSQEFFSPAIEAVSGDAFSHIMALSPEAFDSVLHDPPRFSMAGELYSEDFYRQLHRVLVKGGRLFHYTGTPYIARRGNIFMANAARRLAAAGFRRVSPKPSLLGIRAIK